MDRDVPRSLLQRLESANRRWRVVARGGAVCGRPCVGWGRCLGRTHEVLGRPPFGIPHVRSRVRRSVSDVVGRPTCGWTSDVRMSASDDGGQCRRALVGAPSLARSGRGRATTGGAGWGMEQAVLDRRQGRVKGVEACASSPAGIGLPRPPPLPSVLHRSRGPRHGVMVPASVRAEPSTVPRRRRRLDRTSALDVSEARKNTLQELSGQAPAAERYGLPQGPSRTLVPGSTSGGAPISPRSGRVLAP